MSRLLLSFLILMTSLSYADEDEKPAKIGPDQAITALDPNRGFQLSEAAAKNFGISTQKILNARLLLVPNDAVIKFQEHLGVYRVKDHWFKLIHGQLKKTKDGYLLQSTSLASGDEVVTKGADFLRVAEISVSNQKENPVQEGHHD